MLRISPFKRRLRLVRHRPRSHLAALCADEDHARAAAGGAHRGHAHSSRRWPRTRRRHRVVVDRLPRLQSSAYPTGRTASARDHAACDVRRAGSRTAADAGAPSRGDAAGRSDPRVLHRFRIGVGRGRDEDGDPVLAQCRSRSKRDTFVCFRGGYHGDTLGTMAISDFETGIHQAFGGILHPHLCAALPEDGRDRCGARGADRTTCRPGRRHHRRAAGAGRRRHALSRSVGVAAAARARGSLRSCC